MDVSERPRTGMELLVDGLALSKAGKKRLDKLNRINIHLHGECSTSWVTFGFRDRRKSRSR